MPTDGAIRDIEPSMPESDSGPVTLGAAFVFLLQRAAIAVTVRALLGIDFAIVRRSCHRTSVVYSGPIILNRYGGELNTFFVMSGA